jgi:cell division protein FtsB
MTANAPQADQLAQADTETAYQEKLLELLRSQTAVNLDQLTPPPAPGFFGNLKTVVRRWLWRLCRYQHQLVTDEHNALHQMQTDALSHQYACLKHQLDTLNARIKALESGQQTPPPAAE